jgi:hypothetical protein
MALRIQGVDTAVKIGCFVRDLYQQMKEKKSFYVVIKACSMQMSRS